MPDTTREQLARMRGSSHNLAGANTAPWYALHNLMSADKIVSVNEKKERLRELIDAVGERHWAYCGDLDPVSAAEALAELAEDLVFGECQG